MLTIVYVGLFLLVLKPLKKFLEWEVLTLS